ncbi:MAG: murein biosynthesis integral membrane protein MurJ [Alphaproteobacteria bacterium]|nr:murein biosynthesis integral membrane protein MurJ [Alphaproteobacteria bacterium]
MSLFKSIATFGGFTFISRITGFIRDMILANFLGAGVLSDAFFVSFKLPNLFRSLFAEGAFTSAFVPIFSQKLVTQGKKKSLFFASKSISVLVFFLMTFVILFEIFMPYVVNVLAPGFVNDVGKIELAISLCRITFPFLLLVSIVSFQAGILNSFEKFAAPASAPIILNLTMIMSSIAFVPFTPTPAHGFAIGITVAGILEILWLQFFLNRQHTNLKICFKVFKILKDKEIMLLFKRIAPGVVGSGIYQINMLVDTILVSLVGTGAISWLYYANRLQQLPLGVVGAAISVALLPILSKQLKTGDEIESKSTQNKAVEYAALLSFPAAMLMIVMAKPMINILFEHGQFSSSDTTKTAFALMAYSIGLPCYVIVKALMPNFFARGDTITPVKFSAVVFSAHLIFSLILMRPFGHVGIAIATTISAFVSLVQYVYGLKKRGFWSYSADLLTKVGKIILASIIMGGTILIIDYGINLYLKDWLELNIIIKLFIFGVMSVFGLATFLFSVTIMNVLNISEVLKLLKRKRGNDDKATTVVKS